MTSKRSYGFIIIAIVMFAFNMTGCSSEKDEQPVMHNEVRVLFTYEGFCGVGYNDIILKAVETCSKTYGFEYSFLVPETLEAGMEDYRSWLQQEKDPDVGKSLYIFASNSYESLLENEDHPDPDSGKDILLFESEKEVPYAYTFAMSYYGSSYMIGNILLPFIPNSLFTIIAANPYIAGLNYITDGFQACIDDNQKGGIDCHYLTNDPGGGFGDQEEAYLLCMLIEEINLDSGMLSVFVPVAGSSNLGVYRYSRHKIGITIGVDYIGNFASDFITQTMNKRMDLALSDFFSPWTLGEEISRHRFYTLESGRVTVTQSENHMFDIAEEDWKAYLDSAISKEKEYFKHKDNL